MQKPECSLATALRFDIQANGNAEEALFAGFNSSLCSGQTGDGDSPWRAADVVQADFVAEKDGLRVAAVLAADTDLQVWSS